MEFTEVVVAWKASSDSMIFRAMKSHTNEHTVRGRLTLKHGCQNKPATGAFHRLFWILRQLHVLWMLVGQFWAWYWRNKMEIAAYFLDGTSYSKTYWQPCLRFLRVFGMGWSARPTRGQFTSKHFEWIYQESYYTKAAINQVYQLFD